MPYIPKEHEKYDLLPFSRKRGGEVFEYPCFDLYRLEEYLNDGESLDPYGYSSYEEYYTQIDRIVNRFSDQSDVAQLFTAYKEKVIKLNQKEQWSVLQYIGPPDDRVFGLTPGRNYYWPSSYSNPIYSGVVDDEEFTSYLYPTDSNFWVILEDPTEMAYNTIYGNGKNKLSKEEHDRIMAQLKNAVSKE